MKPKAHTEELEIKRHELEKVLKTITREAEAEVL